MEMKCQRCKHEWNYDGKIRRTANYNVYTNCPKCRTSVKIPKPIKEGNCMVCNKPIGKDNKAYGDGEKELPAHYDCAMEIINKHS